MFRTLCTLGCLLVALPAWAQDGKGYYRFPTIHGETIVFAAEGDLWRVPVTGGRAQRLTTHPGEETATIISPDGRTVAFSGTYEGGTELYTMPLAGGLPIRWTYDGDAATATAWTPDGRLVYSTRHYATLPDPQLVVIDLADGTRERIPLAEATEATYDATGDTLLFVRPSFHGNVTKRYRGGTARKIWRFATGAAEAETLTPDYVGESHSPVWWDDRVYFVTDRDGTMNLWSMEEAGTGLRQHTRHAGWDLRDPAVSTGRLVYQVGQLQCPRRQPARAVLAVARRVVCRPDGDGDRQRRPGTGRHRQPSELVVRAVTGWPKSAGATRERPLGLRRAPALTR